MQVSYLYSLLNLIVFSSRHMFKFMGFVNATGMFDQLCRYSAVNQGVVCDVSQSPEPVYSVRGSAVVHLMPLCVTDSINRKAHAYIEGTMLDKREFLKNPVPIKVPPLSSSTSSSGGDRFYSTLRVKSKCNAPDFSDNCNLVILNCVFLVIKKKLIHFLQKSVLNWLVVRQHHCHMKNALATIVSRQKRVALPHAKPQLTSTKRWKRRVPSTPIVHRARATTCPRRVSSPWLQLARASPTRAKRALSVTKAFVSPLNSCLNCVWTAVLAGVVARVNMLARAQRRRTVRHLIRRMRMENRSFLQARLRTMTH